MVFDLGYSPGVGKGGLVKECGEEDLLCGRSKHPVKVELVCDWLLVGTRDCEVKALPECVPCTINTVG